LRLKTQQLTVVSANQSRVLIYAILLYFTALAWTAFGATQSGPAVNCSVTANPDICALVEAGQLSDLHWRNFSDLRVELRNFYSQTSYAPAWTKDNQPTAQALTIIHLLQDADKKGLRTQDYDGLLWNDRTSRLASSAAKPTSSDLACFDVSLTVSVMRYVTALYRGRVNPRHLRVGIDVGDKKYELSEFLRSRVVNAPDANIVMEEVEPSFLAYRRTRAALEHYLGLAAAGDGDPLPVFKKAIKPGEIYSGAEQLAERLQRFSDLSKEAATTAPRDAYSGALVEGVKHFQLRHGLQPDGNIDRATYIQLMLPISRRIVQLQLTLERWRWLPGDLPHRLLVVNVPEFRLRAIDDHHASLTMRVVVGKTFPEHQTPVFQEQLEYLIFRPYWNVPRNITRKELIPAIAKSPGYLEKHQYEIVNRGSDLVQANAEQSSFFDRLRSGELQIRQKPGPTNALGPIKFVFPNNYDVYLHGTPEQGLFSRYRRAFSHGCIRIEDPAALAAWVLRDDPSWTQSRIQAAMNASTSLKVDLPKPIPVLVLYSTALVAEDGEVHFFEDIYGQDAKLERALAGGYPYPR
jgi:murein L,D-transpeptidase YcbB/YkuD